MYISTPARLRVFQLVVVTILLSVFSQNSHATIYQWVGPVAGGAWTTAANWSPSGPPPSGAGHTVVIDPNTTGTCAITAVPTATFDKLVIGLTYTSSTVTLSGATTTLTVAGAYPTNGLQVNSNLTLLTTNGVNITTAGAILSQGKTITIPSGRTLTVTGYFLNQGTISNSGTVTCNATTCTVDYNSSSSQTILPLNYYNLTSTSSGARVLSSTGTIGVAGAFTPGTNSYTITGSTINYNGTTAQTVDAFDYNNLTISGARTTTSVTLESGTIQVAGTFTNSATFTTGGFITTGNTFTYNGTGTQTIAAFNYNNLSSTGTAARTLASSGIIGINGTFTPGSNTYTITGSTISYTSSSSQNIVAFNYNNLTGNGGAGARVLANSGTIGVAGTFTPGTNTYTITGSTINFNGSATQTIPAFDYNDLTSSSTGNRTLANGGTIRVRGVFTPGTNTYTVTGNTFEYNGTGSQTVAASSYNNLTISGGRSFGNITLGSGTINIAGALSLSYFNVTSIINTGNTVNFNGSTAQTIPGGAFTNFFRNLSTANSAGVTVGSSGGSTITILGNLTVTSGRLNDGGNQIAFGTAGSTLTVGASATLQIGTSSNPTDYPTTNVSTHSLNASSTVEYNSINAQDISNVPTYGNLSLTNSASTVTKRLMGNTVLNGVLSVATNNTLNLRTYDLTINGGTTPITNNGTIGASTTGSANIILAGANLMSNLTNAGTFNPLFNLSVTNTNASGVTLGGSGFQVQNFSIANGSTFNLVNQTLPIAGTYTNSGTLNGNGGTSGTLEFNGTSGAQSLNIGAYVGSLLNRLRVNNAAGLTLTAPLNVNAGTTPLILSSGLLNTDATNILTVTSTAALTGSATSYVNGPMRRRIPNNQTAALTLLFPIGKGSYNQFEMVNPKTGTTGATVDIQAEVVDAAAGGTAGIGFTASPDPNRHWRTSVVNGSANFTFPGTIRLLDASVTISGTSAIGFSTTQTGAYNTIGGTAPNSPATGNITSVASPSTSMGFFKIATAACVSGTYTVGPTGDFARLTEAVAFLNAALVCNDVVFELQSNYNGTNEVFPVTLNAVNYNAGGPYNVTFRPAAGATNLVTTGTPASGVNFIVLDGAQHIIFDGRSGGTGSTINWTLRNTQTSSTYTPTVQFIDDASFNKLQYLNIESENANASSGTILFGATTATTGNDNDTIQYCNITDRTDISNSFFPYNAIYALGTAAKTNSDNLIANNNISNFFQSSGQSSAIRIESNNTAWEITGNRVFQTSARTPTTGEQWLVYLNSAGQGGYKVTNNVFGYAAANGTGTYAFNGSGAARFIGLRVATTSGAQNQITGNTFANIAMTSTSGATTPYGLFSAIYLEGSASANIDDNTIGATTGNDAITIQTATAGANSYGIANASSGTVIINNNKIGAITVTGSTAAASHAFTAIYSSSSTGNVDITNNLIGSASTVRSIRANTANTVTATGTAQIVYGIFATGGAGGVVDITGNQIRNLYTNATTTSTSTQLRGISVNSAAFYTVDNNIIYNLETEAVNTGVGASATVVGIIHNGGGTSQSISGNTIYGLQINATGVQSNMCGIVWNASSALTNSIDRNFIHSFNSANTIAASEQVGIYMVGNFGATVANNMIRLGIKTDGNPVNTSNNLTGIYDNSTAACNYYFNTVLINGASAASGVAANTYAFRRAAASGAKILQNNIFANNRTGGAGGSLHLAFATNTVTGYTGTNFNYNIYHSADGTYFSTTASPASIAGGTPALKLQNLRTLVSGSNLNSGVATLSQINFVSPAGDASAVSLKLANPTAASNAGVNGTGETTDREGDSRTTTPEIGADEGPFTAIVAATDIYTPVVTVGALPTISAVCGTSQTIPVTATITDVGTGLATGSLAPVLWWRLSSGTWASVAVSSVSGSTYTFNLNLTGITGGQTYQYYVAAQDQATTPNMGFSHFDATSPVHTDVVSQTSAPTTPGSFTISSAVPLSGTVNVGTGQTYTTFNGASGLFAAINSNGLSDNLVVNVTSDITETTTTGLNQVTYHCGGPYTITIQPSTTTIRTISASITTALIQFNGADNVVVEGNSGGSGRFLRFRNTNTTTGSVFQMQNDATNITIQNCDIQGQGTSTTASTVVAIGTATAVGNSNITINNNLIHDAGTGGYPLNLIYSNGTTAYPNNNINITNNEIYNFGSFGGASNRRAYGINVTATGNGGNWTISGNSIYSTYIDGTGYQTCINFYPGASSNNNVINSNYIGGRAPLCGGQPMTNNTSSDFIGIAINAGNGTGTTIQGNTIQNMLADYGDGSGVTAIDVAGSTRVTITGNTIGHATLVNSLQSDGGSTSLSVASGWVYGVYSATSSPISITNNTIAGLASVGIYNSYVNIIEHVGSGAATITGNTMGRTYSSGSSTGYNTKGIVVTSNATGHNISNNTLTFIGNGSSGAISGPTADGIQVTSTGGGVIANNTIDGLFNAGNGGYSVGIWMNGSGTWTVSNNMLNLLNYNWLGTYTTRKEFYGILDYTTGGSVKYYYNTVLVQGSQTGTSSFDYPSECFYKLPGGSGSGSGGATELKNNIFINSRTGNPTVTTKHYAIDNSSSTPGTNWVSDNNFLSTVNNATLGYWTGAGDVDFANWKSNTGGDANSTSAQATTGTSSSTAANPAELFVAPLTGNLHINTTPPNAPYPYDFVSNRGVTVSTTTDFDGDVRTSTPDIGADEFFICTTPVVSANTPTNPTCSGNDGSIALSGLAANTTFSVTYNRNATPVAAANYTTNGSGVLTIGGLNGGTYNNFVITLGAGCSSAAYPSSGSITLTAPVCGPNTWEGDVVGAGTDWFNNGNWSTGVAPTSCADNVVIPTAPIGNNFPTITGASAQVGNITVQSGATISIDNARTLSVCGDWTGSSTATPSTVTGAGKVVLTGGTAQAVSGRTTFSTLQVAKTTGTVATVQSGSNLSVTAALELASGNLTNSGSLTLKSTSTSHAIFNDFGAPVGTYTGTYTGTINEERYYRATSANSYNQHYMGSPVANATLAQFGAGGTSGAVTPTADCSETQLDQTSVYGSVFSYNEADGATCPMKSWNVKAGSMAATPAQGFSVAKTGAGVLTVSGTPNTATSYAVSGLTNSNWTKGTLQHPSNTAFGSGWHMVSNPYNATLDLTSITPPAGFDNQIQVWDVIQGQYYTLTGTKLIAPFQAFFVHKTSPGGSATYTIDGNWRVATPATFYAQSIPEQLTITATNNSNQLYDVTTVGFNNNATDQFDAPFDANKLTGSIGRHNLSTQNNGYELNTNILTSIQTTSTVNMTFEPGSAGTYTLTFDGLNSFDPTSYIMLEDKQLNTMHDVRSGDYTFTATAQDDWNRFVLHFTPKAEIATVDQQCETPGAINVTQPGSASWTYTITDANNTTVSSGTLNEATPIAVNTPTGTYTLTLTDANNYTVVKNITVGGTTPIVAAFTPSANTTTTNTDVAFNSTTTATDYYWDFGDGTTATGQNVIHSYGDTGTYTVSLIVISANGCSNTTTQTVTVNAEVQTGLNNLNPNQNITIWSNGNTVYVDFSRLTKTDATIEIYNVLGQQLVNERYGRSSIFNKAIGNVEAAYVIVKVKQGETITTKKVLIGNTR